MIGTRISGFDPQGIVIQERPCLFRYSDEQAAIAVRGGTSFLPVLSQMMKHIAP